MVQSRESNDNQSYLLDILSQLRFDILVLDIYIYVYIYVYWTIKWPIRFSIGPFSGTNMFTGPIMKITNGDFNNNNELEPWLDKIQENFSTSMASMIVVQLVCSQKPRPPKVLVRSQSKPTKGNHSQLLLNSI